MSLHFPLALYLPPPKVVTSTWAGADVPTLSVAVTLIEYFVPHFSPANACCCIPGNRVSLATGQASCHGPSPSRHVKL